MLDYNPNALTRGSFAPEHFTWANDWQTPGGPTGQSVDTQPIGPAIAPARSFRPERLAGYCAS